MGRQVQRGRRGGLLAYLAQPSQLFSVLALSGLLFDVGCVAVAGVEWAFGRAPARSAPALMMVALSAVFCTAAVFVRPSRLKQGIAIVGVGFAAAVFGLFWPSIGLPG